ncbi:MAG: 30S ribosome-binding factor RbfA [Phycisphaeraceae bacterium]|nr:MAG: 30S ribosome-binding factor RbfA [Phycisphaeraceae bacterium]
MSRRCEQLASTLHRGVQTLLTRGLSDPRISGTITVTEVKVSPDLKVATVSVSIMPESAEKLTMHGLTSASRHIRHQVSDMLDLSRTPEIRFRLDRTIKEQAAIFRAISEATAGLKPLDEAGEEDGSADHDKTIEKSPEEPT